MGEVAPNRRAQNPEARVRDGEPGRAASQREKQAFDEHLPKEPRSSRPQCRSHHHLTGPANRSGELQARHVGARNQKEQRDGTEEQQHRGFRVAKHALLQADDVNDLIARSLAVLLREPGGDPVHVGGRLGTAIAMLEPADHRQEWSDPGRQDRFERPELFQRHPELCCGARVRKPKARRHDADDGVGGAVECEKLPDDVVPAAEPIAPERLANHDGARRCGIAVGRQERAAGQRRHSQERKEVGRHGGGDWGVWIAKARQRGLRDDVCRERLKRAALFLPVEKAGIGNRLCRRRLVLRRRNQRDEPLGLGVGQRLEKNRVGHGKDGRVCADAKGECEHRDRCETG